MVCYIKTRTHMRTNTIDWRVIVGLIFLFLILFSRSPQTNVVALAIGAGWAFNAGLMPWRSRNVLGSTKVTYWRGERIVTRQPRRSPFRAVTGTQLLVSLVYLALALGLTYAAVITFARIVA